jgi:pimeloyl-ACP methyl ester carboxylesterase
MNSINDNTVVLKDGRKLGYAEYGDAKGKHLFFFHGWPTSRLHGKRFGEAGKKLRIRVISVDRAGYGLSDYKKNRTLLDYPDDILELADHLNLNKFAVVGVSGGGPYAAVCAYKIPERLTKVGIVVGLAPTYVPGILDGMPWLTKLGWANYGKYPLLRTSASVLHYLNSKYGPHLGMYRFFFGAKSDKKIFADSNARKLTLEGVKEAFRTTYKGAEMDLKLYTTSWGFDLIKIKVPVYLWYGGDDQNVTLAMGKYYASKIPSSKLVIYSKEGHLCQITHAEEILKTLC